LAGIVTAVVVIVALYGLTPAFFWIPTAGLSAVIIHAVADLVASPSQVYSFWRVSPLEFFIWLAAVLVTVFSSIENGIYTSIGASLVLLLIRVAYPRGHFLGRVTVHADKGAQESRDVYVPLKGNGVNNSDIKVAPPSPGIIIYRLEESYIYPNSGHVNGVLVDFVKENLRRGKDMTHVKLSDRPWNDPGPGRGGGVADQAENVKKPVLRAIVLDFSAISHIDTTGVQSLIDTRSEVERWADHPVEFHFATVLSPWVRRALIAGGFGIGVTAPDLPREVASVVPYRGGNSEADITSPVDDPEALGIKQKSGSSSASVDGVSGQGFLLSSDTPFFHIDLAAAVRAAERGNNSSITHDDVKV